MGISQEEDMMRGRMLISPKDGRLWPWTKFKAGLPGYRLLEDDTEPTLEKEDRKVRAIPRVRPDQVDTEITISGFGDK